MIDTTKTCDTIMDELQKKVQDSTPVAPSEWVDYAQELLVLLGEEHRKLWNMAQGVAQMKIKYLEQQEKRNVSEVNMRVEATDEYREMRMQEAKVSRIEEYIRLAKHRAKMANEEMRGY
jgi:hypothetical protein